ncbi:MAG: PLP-dependent aminotransferase family protein [Deltaproteobacteria bacterium]|nr:PLP-dependent aminotransferase family protein [Deltaproteobacteria bacterium]
MWHLEPGDGAPLYKRIIRHLEAAVASGHLAPGERLPSERDLARLLSVNRSTVIRALDEMGDRGILVRKRGSGTYVNREKWGVQSYARLNWQDPPALLPAAKAGPFHREAAFLRQRAARSGEKLRDLSRDELAPGLLPVFPIPERSWRDVVRAEQGDEAAHLGLPQLRHSLSAFLRATSGIDAPAEDILITSGSRQAIFLITQCLLKVGDAVGVEAPSYFYSLPVFQAAGLRLYALPMDEHGITLEGLEKLASRRSLKMVFVNPVFHNPTGTVMSDARKNAVLDFCAAARIPIVEDDAYSLLFFRRMEGLSPLKAWDRRNQVIHIGSLSSYAGRNLRAGWLLAPTGIIAKLAAARQMMDAGLSVLPQIIANEYLDNVATRHLSVLRGNLAASALELAAFLRGTFGDRIVFDPPSGGLYTYAVMRDRDARSYAAMQTAFLRHGVIPALGEDFGDARPSFRLNHSLFS